MSRYNGALVARGVHSLVSYGECLLGYYKNTYTTTSMYRDGALKMYASHVGLARAAGGQSELHTIQLRAYTLTYYTDNFRADATAYRSALD